MNHDKSEEMSPHDQSCSTWLLFTDWRDSVSFRSWRNKQMYCGLPTERAMRQKHRRWLPRIEISSCWQQSRKWKPQSYNFRRGRLPVLRELADVFFPSELNLWWDCSPLYPGLLPDRATAEDLVKCVYTSDLRELRNNDPVLFEVSHWWHLLTQQ